MMAALMQNLMGNPHTHRAVTVFSSKKSLMEAILLLAPPKKDLRFDPSGRRCTAEVRYVDANVSHVDFRAELPGISAAFRHNAGGMAQIRFGVDPLDHLIEIVCSHKAGKLRRRPLPWRLPYLDGGYP